MLPLFASITAAAAALLAQQQPAGMPPDEPGWVLSSQRQALVAAVDRSDAASVAGLFTGDSMLIGPGAEPMAGRSAIEGAWKFGFQSGAVSHIDIRPESVEPAGADIRVETGVLLVSGKSGSRQRSHYMIVWKREGGEWKIYRDVACPAGDAAPDEDRVGFPGGYRSQLRQVMAPTLRFGMVETAYANDAAAPSASTGESHYPYGSLLVMEFTVPRQGHDGKPLLDDNGHPLRGDVAHIDVMRRERGFGSGYGSSRAGEWEFASYKEDGSHAKPPSATASCAACHQTGAGEDRDFVFPLTHLGLDDGAQMGAPGGGKEP